MKVKLRYLGWNSINVLHINKSCSSNFSLEFTSLSYHFWFLQVLPISRISVISEFPSLCISIPCPTTYVEAALCFSSSILISFKIQNNFSCHHRKAFNDWDGSCWLVLLILRLSLWSRLILLGNFTSILLERYCVNMRSGIILTDCCLRRKLLRFLSSELSLWNFELRTNS